ncbi:DNA segregation ATPase FtsK/SpoIIIE, S-DNA-T family [Rathayibacter oskolensis]|uniref:DNA segregation ATPase FtsK/SpoIIIE, S-DNA-T family n=1 Tax=Rathayibacter oskolensis TaxID=1891671 RepID=A0A1X7NB80_9MICO|nr:FtsK/SpoIIIE domain-containing protein [Rathayibacter oskolensis]SMH34857.1 DNA segregation ATPase FtsK/SpoIIIE, S-DNA-T family [Rathayibacter oskolensis]
MTFPATASPLREPVPPAVAPRSSFPWIAALAPVLSAVVLYALTSSPYTLALAALGPVVAVASYLDAARVRRRSARLDAERHELLLADHEASLVEARRRELIALSLATPDPLAVLERTLPADARWRRDPAGLRLMIGRGWRESVRSGPLAGAILADAPLEVALTAGIGVVGPRVLTRAFVRGLLVQCAELVPSDALALELPPGPAWDCLRPLPHANRASAPFRLRILEQSSGARDRAGGSDPVVVLADGPDDLPSGCRCVVILGGAEGDRVIGRAQSGVEEELSVDYVSVQQARGYAVALAEALGEGAGEALPDTVRLADLGSLRRGGHEVGLPATLGRTTSGPLEIDLVRDGPHAIIGGTTGSGKSELLIAWILALAARHGPSSVTFLLADFKGGAGFSALAHLPHVTGVITDLDPTGAARAFASIAAELRRREVVLAEHGVPDIARLEPGVLARLVLVVDECAFVLERAPELHRTFADIAARGRSLGIHLVLCTQRPVGVVRDAVAANCGLRIALRVYDPADSRALIGSDAAARIPHGAPGRCIVAVGGREQLAQSAIAQDGDLEAAVRPEDTAVAVHRPWLDPLPSVLTRPGSSGSILLGRVDRPDEQEQCAVAFEGRSLLVLGAAGSGRTGVLRTIAEQSDRARIVGADDAEAAWDAVIEPAAARGILLVDDLDLLLRRCSDDERRRLLDALLTEVRSGVRRLVLTARRPTDGLAALRDAVDDVLLLRAASRQEHQLLAVAGEPYVAALPPGGGWWRGERLQVFLPGDEANVDGPTAVRQVPLGAAPVAVLTNRSAAVRARLAAVGVASMSVEAALTADPLAEGTAVLGSVLEWSSARALLLGMRRAAPVVVDVAPGEARVLLGPLGPAPLSSGDRVLLERDGILHRARWPSSEDLGREESAV